MSTLLTRLHSPQMPQKKGDPASDCRGPRRREGPGPGESHPGGHVAGSADKSSEQLAGRMERDAARVPSIPRREQAVLTEGPPGRCVHPAEGS